MSDERYERGMEVRREVLGDEHVDRAIERTTPFTADFQDLITRYAWGEIWSRPGLDRRTRSAITLTALVALGRDDELAMHVRAALPNGLTADEIKEVLLHSAVYCGVPAANARSLRDRPGGCSDRGTPWTARTAAAPRRCIVPARAGRPSRPVSGGGGRDLGGAARRPRRRTIARIARGGRARRGRPGRDRGRLARLREPGRRGQPQRRADGRAARGPAASRSRA